MKALIIALAVVALAGPAFAADGHQGRGDSRGNDRHQSARSGGDNRHGNWNQGYRGNQGRYVQRGHRGDRGGYAYYSAPRYPYYSYGYGVPYGYDYGYDYGSPYDGYYPGGASLGFSFGY
jgi:hypothetical protein